MYDECSLSDYGLRVRLHFLMSKCICEFCSLSLHLLNLWQPNNIADKWGCLLWETFRIRSLSLNAWLCIFLFSCMVYPLSFLTWQNFCYLLFSGRWTWLLEVRRKVHFSLMRVKLKKKSQPCLWVLVKKNKPIISTGVTFKKGCLESGVHTSIKFLKLLKLD